MVIFQYNLYIFGIRLGTVLYSKLCYNKSCHSEVEVYLFSVNTNEALNQKTYLETCVPSKDSDQHIHAV